LGIFKIAVTLTKINILLDFFFDQIVICKTGAYPEIFRGRGFEIFLYRRENLGGVLGFFFLKNPSKLKKFPKKGRGFDPQNPSLNTPLM